MAHFAELDNNNIVTRVFVVSNDVPTAAGPLGENDMHVDGETWCVNFFKTPNWKQTSKANSFRKQYAGIGFTYDAAKDKFISPQPYPSWVLNSNDDWEGPVTGPTIEEYGDPAKPYFIYWDEAGQKWKARDSEEPQGTFNWDVPTLAWVAE